MSEEVIAVDQIAGCEPRQSDVVSRESLRQDRYDLDKLIKSDTHRTRQTLIGCVGCVSFLWLIFTAFVVLMIGFKYKGFELSDAVMIAFITTSLGTVLGLLAIGLRFFFSHKL